MDRTITQLNTRDELARIDFCDVMAITADGNYTTLTLRSGRNITLLSGLRDMETVARQTCKTLVKVGRSHIINMKYLAMVNTVKRTVTIADDSLKTSMELRISKEGVLAFKRMLEDMEGEPIVDFNPSNCQMSAMVLKNSKRIDSNS